ncbi:hypothetical protein P8935_14395 [Telmatobacter sp. DSM 110680]|uniref:WD40 repeat domain-containing protein n=1 Tax=Telmatobacter sp. DSM 110680 TaxID=3036704 RepID=A0AAU7DEF3_9BACT
MRWETRPIFRISFSVMSLFFGFCAPLPQATLEAQQPRLTVSLTRYGWAPQKSDSDRIFFRDFSVNKLVALDLGTKLVFVSEDVLVVYSTVQKGSDWRTASRQLEAYFIRASDGTLLTKKTWPSTIRKDLSDADSESRIIALENGRFLVDADGRLLLYGSNLSLIRELKLEPFGPTELWGVQSVASGREIFLRHESAVFSDTNLRAVNYEWRDATTFRLITSVIGDVDQGMGVRGAEDGAFIAWSSPSYSIFRPNQPPDKICSNPICNRVTINAVVSSNYLVVSSFLDGIGVVDRQKGLLWFDTPSVEGSHKLAFGSVVAASTGNRFAIWISASKKCTFDSVLIRSSALFLFDINNPRHIFEIPEHPGGGEFALSPRGKQLATFDDQGLHFYDVL